MIDNKDSSQLIERDRHTFFLNGQGILTATIFSVKVYEISLFLEKRSQDPEEIIKSPERKIILLKFLRQISSEQLRSALSDGFRENCANHCDELRVYLDRLNAQIPDLREGDHLEFQFLPEKLILRSNLGNYLEVNSVAFGRILLAIWLGPNPPNSGLKNKVLGLDQ
jgi:hypothetical protein